MNKFPPANTSLFTQVGNKTSIINTKIFIKYFCCFYCQIKKVLLFIS